MLNNSKLIFSANYVYILAIILVITLVTVACEDSNSVKLLEVDETRLLSDEELAYFSYERNNEHGYGSHAHNPITINFGFDLRSSPQEDAKQYLPFLEYLEEATGYHFNLKFTPKSSSTAKELGEDKIQLAAMGAVSFIKADEKYDVQLLVQGINSENKTNYRSFFVVHPESEIKSVNDFHGKSFAFGNFDSTQGHIIPRIELEKHDITLNDFSSYRFTGSHRNCAESVISSQTEICAMQDHMAQSLTDQGLLKIIYRSDYYPSSGIVANNMLSEEQVEVIKNALLNFDPKKTHSDQLYHWDKTEMPNGFAIAKRDEYETLKEWLMKNFLDNKNIQGKK